MKRIQLFSKPLFQQEELFVNERCWNRVQISDQRELLWRFSESMKNIQMGVVNRRFPTDHEQSFYLTKIF